MEEGVATARSQDTRAHTRRSELRHFLLRPLARCGSAEKARVRTWPGRAQSAARSAPATDVRPKQTTQHARRRLLEALRGAALGSRETPRVTFFHAEAEQKQNESEIRSGWFPCPRLSVCMSLCV